MKWLIPTIFGSLVALAVTFPRADEDVSSPETPKAGSTDDVGTPPGDQSTPKSGDDRQAPDNPLTPKSGSGGLTTGDDTKTTTLEFFRLKHSKAASVAEILKKMYPAASVDIAVDEPTNSLILNFPAGSGSGFSAVVEKLDKPAPAESHTKRPASGKRGKSNPPSSAPGMMMMPAHGSSASSMFAAMAGRRDSGAATDGQDFEQYEASCRELAKTYQAQQKVTPTDQKKLAELKAELSGAVHAAFFARQTYQRAQATQLRERLAQIEQHISQRGQLANEIIERRVEELLQPERQWESDTESTARSAPPTGNRSASNNPMAADAADDRGDQNKDPNLGWSTDYYRSLMSSRETGRPLLIYFHAVNSPQCRALEDHFLKNSDVRKFVKERFDAASVNVNSSDGKELFDQYQIRSIPTLLFVDPAGTPLLRIEGLPQGNTKAFLSEMQEIAAKKDVTKPEQPSSSPSTAASSFRLTPDLSTDPRQVVFDADNAIVQATNEIEASKSALGLAERRMNRMQELFKTGQLPAREVDAVETDVERHRSALKKSQTEREAGVRRLQVAREFLDGQIKIAELELHQAESRLDLASNNEARALNLAKQNVIAKEQLDAAVAAREQAQIQVQRAKTILDLYKRPLPGRTSPAGDTGDVDRGARKPSGEDIPGTPGKVPSRSNRPGE